MCDLIYDVIIYCVWIDTYKVGANDEILIENL